MTEEAKTGEPQADPVVSVVGPRDGETIVREPDRPAVMLSQDADAHVLRVRDPRATGLP
ncbi:hypothetical protein [Streptomyces asoensis]|uniref:hypothetical protein n=1 Tax=Streptomyces asoensis TaxID=249586 RepID=UPI0033CA7199